MTFIFCCVYNQIYGYFSPCAFSTQQKTRRSGFSAGALRMPDTSEVAGDYSPAWSLTSQTRSLRRQRPPSDLFGFVPRRGLSSLPVPSL
ncbi:hypothetical protein G3S79_004835 [Escherichia coli]|nr:hypothetical protein [Escherichia coli]